MKQKQWSRHIIKNSKRCIVENQKTESPNYGPKLKLKNLKWNKKFIIKRLLTSF